MSMSNRGYTKLIEECAELIQVAAKRISYPEDPHPDEGGNLNTRIEFECADVMAAMTFVINKNGLNVQDINAMMMIKLEFYAKWDQENG